MNNVSGVYKIVCNNNNKFYIGSSININKRFNEHKNLLRQNKHTNIYLQKCWNRYGEQNFRFKIVETIKDVGQLFKREKRYINNTNCCDRKIGFNISHDPRNLNLEKRYIDLTGQRFGKLTAMEHVGKTKNGVSKWKCLCDCGKEKIISSSNFKNGSTKSCGCLRVELAGQQTLKHGHAKTGKESRIYRTWINMIQRCTNHKNKDYKNYGGKDKSITVCKRWLDKKNGFKNFLKDMGEPPTNKHQIGRINKKLGYYKNNCKWVLSKENSRNKTTNKLITYKGKTQCLSAWAEELGLSYPALKQRLNNLGWTVEKAFNTPVRKRKNK